MAGNARRRIGFVTSGEYRDLTPDDRSSRPAFAACGMEVVPVVWTEPMPERLDALVLRSTWDYHLHLPEFLRWVAKVEASGLPLWNPPSTVRWNVDKAYLAEVEARGARIVPTRFAGRGSRTSLLALMLEAGWTEAVVKPSVSGGAFETWRAHRTPEDGARFARQLAQMDCLVQPLVPELITDGEWSLLFFEGRYSHAVLKRPGPEDFRVQEEFGGLFAAARPSPEVVADATRALGATGRETLYARVDGVLRGGALELMELELVEPTLFLEASPGAAERFADAVAKRLR